MTEAWLISYVKQVQVPTLVLGYVAILDNPPPHTGGAVREVLEASGSWALFLSPYDLDLNPIENASVKLRALLSKAGARTIKELRTVIGESLDAFTTPECADYLVAADHDAD